MSNLDDVLRTFDLQPAGDGRFDGTSLATARVRWCSAASCWPSR